jgi:hypothetical protein
MKLLLLILGLGCLVMMTMAIIGGNYFIDAVLFASLLTYLSIWKWKRSIPVDKWNQSRFKYGRIGGIIIGLGLFFIAMLQLGIVVRTLWANYFGQESHSVDFNDIFTIVMVAIIAFALVGYEKLAAVIAMQFFFSLALGGVVDHFFIEPRNYVQAWPNAFGYMCAFLCVFILGQSFRWSKGFALCGLLCIVLAYLGLYLTM